MAGVILLSAASALAAAETAFETEPNASELAPEPAAADSSPEERAKRAFEAGVQALSQRQWTNAEAFFRESLALVRRQSTLYDLAVALYMQGRARECIAVLDEMLHFDASAGSERYEHNAALLRERARAELSTVRLVVSPATAEVRIDGQATKKAGAERSLDVVPGRHEVEVSAAGHTTKRLVLVTRARSELERAVNLEILPVARAERGLERSARPREPALLRLAPWIPMGTGGALLTAGAVTGIVALRNASEYKDQCPSKQSCPASSEDAYDRAQRFGLISTALLASGAVLAAGGFTWHLLLPSASKSDRTAGLGVTGRF